MKTYRKHVDLHGSLPCVFVFVMHPSPSKHAMSGTCHGWHQATAELHLSHDIQLGECHASDWLALHVSGEHQRLDLLNDRYDSFLGSPAK